MTYNPLELSFITFYFLKGPQYPIHLQLATSQINVILSILIFLTYLWPDI